MTASRKPKTPSMNMLVRDGIAAADIDSFCRKASRLTLAQVVDRVSVKEKLTSQGNSRTKDFTIDLTFYPKSDYESEYDVDPSEILTVFGTKFSLILKREVQNELKKLDQDLKSQMTNLGKGKAARPTLGDRDDNPGEDDEGGSRPQRADDDDVSEVGDGDASAEKRQRQTKEQATYDDDEDSGDDDTDGFLKEFDDAEIEAAYASVDGGSEDVEMSDESDELAERISQVESLFMENFPCTTSFSFSDTGCSIGLQVGRY